ncbi:restriction endonuclease subunit S [Mycoplasmopsis felis]|uniref:restriction endonuclease subunit S n=1 Tax=Mycoplasmopsis felis TaxID=33923 RepID=UPI002AFE96E4|nr:restriction endonuclease subunit S [Mycoplasmopsis felis]WQQ08171.1 restriction endonuclease subunit S [Mycoplasmopsis felis]
MKKVLVPRVRFKGFYEEWKEEKFGELLFRINEKGYEFLETLTASKSGEMLKRKSINYHIQVAKESLKNYNRVLKNDFVLHLSTYESGLAYSKEIGITSPAYDVLRFFDKNNNDPIFFKYVFSNKKFINSLVPFTYGLRQGKSINLEELNKSLIEKTNVSEQQKIGKLLENIDNLITLEEIKLNKLKQLKQTLLQKMFPEYNSKIPRIRFKGFEGEWEEEKLDDIFKVITGGEPPKNYKNSKHPVGKYKYPIYSNGQEANAIWGFSDNYSINTEAITISSIGTIGFPVVRKMFFTPIIRLKTLLPYNKNMNINFLNLSVSQINFSFNQAGIPSMNSNQLKDNIILISRNFSEQQKIGDFFCKIDTLINLYNSKLNKLRQIKESLLQKMFV